MTSLLVRLFIKDKDNRESYGNLAGYVGIITNILLFAVKFLIGIFTSSISIMTDAVNNLSDSSASIVTVIGFKISAKPADDEHPYGHARFEYISGLLVSVLVLLVGGQFLISSVKKTFNPEPIDFSFLVAVILVLSILLKVWQSIFYNKIGKKINSNTLKATAVDSRNDVIITAAVLVTTLLEYFTGWKLDGPAGIIVSLFVIYSGIELIRETTAPLIGQAPNEKLIEEIYTKVNSYPSVIESHDLIIHTYGHGKVFASIHVEMPSSQDVMLSHEIIDEMERCFNTEYGIQLVVHYDPVVTDDKQQNELEKRLVEITKEINPDLYFHDFRMIKEGITTKLLFDISVPTDVEISNSELRETFASKVRDLGESYETLITIDRNYTVCMNH